MKVTKRSISAIFSCCSLLAATNSYALFPIPMDHPYYIGVQSGYGQTTWGQLVPYEQNSAILLSTPVHVTEGGILWGAVAGYEYSPNFAVEASYAKYPDAKVMFTPDSLFTFDNYDSNLITHTDTISLIGKIMLTIPNTNGFRIFSGAGPAYVHRYDKIVHKWRLSPTFAIGGNYNVNCHWMFEVGGNYTAGYGESEISPVNDYVPFLYSGYFRIIYRI